MVASTRPRTTRRAALPRAVYVLQSGLLVNALGNGAAAPFLLIYLHDVRGIPLPLAALAGSAAAATAVASAMVAGAAADRVGARPAMLGGLALSVVAYLLYPLVREPWQAFAAAGLAGAGIGTWLTMQSALLAAITPAELRHRAFAQQRVAANVGLGLGGLVGGLLVTVAEPASFSRLFLLNALTFVLYGAAISRLAVPAVAVPSGRPRGYRSVLADRPFAGLALLNFVLVAAGVALLTSLFPLYARNEVGAAEATIGLLFLLNALLIIAAQLPIARAHEGHRRMTGLAMTATLFATAWLLVAAAGSRASVVLLVGAVLVFAVGECLYDVVVGPLVADLAPEELRGRYMAVSGLSWQLGFIAGPALGGLLLSADARVLWPVEALACLAAAAGALLLERALPAAVRSTPRGG